jgi:TrmH family RNA methyltransferase
MQSLSERDTPQGLIATFPLFTTPLNVALAAPARLQSESVPPAARLIIIVDRLQDPGNLGTIIRTADAVGAQAVILLEPTVDPFDPKTVRGTMGSLFTVPLVSVDDVAPLFEQLHQQDYRIAGADGYQGHIPWQMGDSLKKMALILGNEARGLSDDLHPHITHWLRLPMFGQAESLNVAVAGGVLMYHWLAQVWLTAETK